MKLLVFISIRTTWLFFKKHVSLSPYSRFSHIFCPNPWNVLHKVCYGAKCADNIWKFCRAHTTCIFNSLSVELSSILMKCNVYCNEFSYRNMFYPLRNKQIEKHWYRQTNNSLCNIFNKRKRNDKREKICNGYSISLL